MNPSTTHQSGVLLAVAMVSIIACSREVPGEAAVTPVATKTPQSHGEAHSPFPPEGPEVIVVSGIENAIANLKSENWWEIDDQDAQLSVPRVLLAGISPTWRASSQELTVADKKRVFYRLMLPLIMHANEMVKDRRSDLFAAQARLADGEALRDSELEALRQGAVLFRVASKEQAADWLPDSPELAGMIDQMLYRLDVVPAGLALGQAAYESGYATSRFAVEGNAFFGQWTFGGEGLVPEQQRKNLGDHRIASFEWPFDSVRGYFINLMSHPAYEDFRQLRAELRNAGEPLTSLRLADGLIRYSERGQEYVDTLKGIVRANHLETADNAVFRDEPVRFTMGAESPEAAEQIKQEIERMRQSGELQQIVARMRLD